MGENGGGRRRKEGRVGWGKEGGVGWQVQGCCVMFLGLQAVSLALPPSIRDRDRDSETATQRQRDRQRERQRGRERGGGEGATAMKKGEMRGDNETRW